MRSASVTLIRDGQRVRTEPVVFAGPGKTITLEANHIVRQFLEPLPDRALDFLEIAAAVGFADATFPRGADDQPDHGRHWRRRLDFDLTVRDTGFWQRDEVRAALTDATAFLTDDDVAFNFRRSDAVLAPAEPYFRFVRDSEGFRADEVVMFSGGLDCVAGILETLETTNKRLALVTRRSAQKHIRFQMGVFRELRTRYPGRLLWIPVKVTRSGSTGRDRTQRSRSLLFTALGYAVARLFGAAGITFFENGIVSMNLPIAGQVAGTLATRTTHPAAMARLSHLTTLVAEEPFPVRNPFVLQTKTEVVQRFRTHRAEPLIARTVSCNEVHGRSNERRQCGSCSQCLDRTFALHAAGLHAHERPDDYEVDVFTGRRKHWKSRIMAVEWVRHGLALSKMSDMEFMQRFGSDVSRARPGFPDLSAGRLVDEMYQLHKRHGEAVVAARRAAIMLHAERLARADLDPSSLLLVHGEQEIPVPAEPAAFDPRRVQAMDPEVPVPVASQTLPLPLVVTFHDRGRVSVPDLADFVTTQAALLSDLKAPYDADRAALLAPEDHKFTPTRDLSGLLSCDEPYCRKLVERIRDDLEASWREIHASAPPQQLLVQSKPRKGYRLDPTILVIAPAASSRSPRRPGRP